MTAASAIRICLVSFLLDPLGSFAQEPVEAYRLTVSDAVQLALERGTEAELVRQSIAITQAEIGVVRSNAMVTVNFDAGYQRNLKRPVIFFPEEDGSGTRSIELGQDADYHASLAVRQPVYSFGRLSSALRAAKGQHDASRLAGMTAAGQIALGVKLTYFQALLAQKQTLIAQLSLSQVQRSAQQITQQMRSGIRSEFERLQADVAVAARAPMVTRSASESEITQERLKRLLGLPIGSTVVLSDSLAFVSLDLSRDAAVEHALTHSQSLAAARARIRAAEAVVHLHQANDRPLLFIDGNYRWQAQTSSLVPESRERAQSAAVGMTLSWPIFDGRENRYRTQQASIHRREADLLLRQLEDEVRLGVHTIWARLESVTEELASTNTTVSLAQESYRLAKVRYQSGLSTLLEVLAAELALTQARHTHAESLFRYNVLCAELETQMGMGPPLTAATVAP